jgi:hypothetical protein
VGYLRDALRVHLVEFFNEHLFDVLLGVLQGFDDFLDSLLVHLSLVATYPSQVFSDLISGNIEIQTIQNEFLGSEKFNMA